MLGINRGNTGLDVAPACGPGAPAARPQPLRGSSREPLNRDFLSELPSACISSRAEWSRPRRQRPVAAFNQHWGSSPPPENKRTSGLFAESHRAIFVLIFSSGRKKIKGMRITFFSASLLGLAHSFSSAALRRSPIPPWSKGREAVRGRQPKGLTWGVAVCHGPDTVVRPGLGPWQFW